MPTTTRPLATELANFLGGFTAAEGYFRAKPGDGRFSFVIALGAADQTMVDLFRDFLGCGRTARYPRRKPHFDDEVTFVVSRLHDLVEIVVPFMDEHLPMSYKRLQYERWRAPVLEHWTRRATIRQCSFPGCERRGKREGLCGAHFFLAFGR